MLIHFIGSRSRLAKEIDNYRRIVAYVESKKHTIVNPWLEDAYALTQQGLLKSNAQSWEEIDRDNSMAISKADVVIVEGTHKGFFAGYQVSQAAMLKKPLLLLTRDKSPVAISGLSTPSGFIKSVAYNKNTLEAALDDFLNENTVATKDLRFNFFLDRQTYNYLRWMSSKTGKTKAQIIRSLLQKEMRNED